MRLQSNHFGRRFNEVHDDIQEVKVEIRELAEDMKDVKQRVTKLEAQVRTPYEGFTLGATKSKYN